MSESVRIDWYRLSFNALSKFTPMAKRAESCPNKDKELEEAVAILVQSWHDTYLKGMAELGYSTEEAIGYLHRREGGHTVADLFSQPTESEK
jgi:hypothetical protein